MLHTEARLDSTPAPVVRAAKVHVTVTSPTSCDVTISLGVEGASEIEHRVDTGSPAGAGSIELVTVEGARQVGALGVIGRTQSLVLQPAGPTYRIHYRARVPDAFASRCPVWLPTVPTDGLSRAVTLEVDLPSGSRASDSMPALEWTGTHGETTLGHLPAFVRVSYGPAGTTSEWGIAQTMDALTVAIIVIATAIWIWRGRR